MEQTPTPKRNRAYSPKFKVEVLQYAEENSDNKASKVYKVPRSVIPVWRSKKENYQVQLNGGNFSTTQKLGVG